MISRVMAGLLVAGTLTLGVMGMTGTASAHSWPWDPKPASAPELDPSAIGGGLVLLIGTVMAVRERRRATK
jgi:hypothetical protein